MWFEMILKKSVETFINNTDLAIDNDFHSRAERQMPGCHKEAVDPLYRENIYNLVDRKRHVLRKSNSVPVGSSSSMSSSSA